MPLLYHNTNACFKKYTNKVYTKPSHAENEVVESKSNTATMSITKKSMPILQRNSVSPRDITLTENRHSANSQ